MIRPPRVAKGRRRRRPVVPTGLPLADRRLGERAVPPSRRGQDTEQTLSWRCSPSPSSLGRAGRTDGPMMSCATANRGVEDQWEGGGEAGTGGEEPMGGVERARPPR